MLMNMTLMVHPSVLPFAIAAIHTFPRYHYIFGHTVTDHGDGIFSRQAALLSRGMTFAEVTMMTLDAKDVSRPVVIDMEHESCVLCAQGTSHTMRLHEALQGAQS